MLINLKLKYLTKLNFLIKNICKCFISIKVRGSQKLLHFKKCKIRKKEKNNFYKNFIEVENTILLKKI